MGYEADRESWLTFEEAAEEFPVQKLLERIDFKEIISPQHHGQQNGWFINQV